MVDKCTHYFRYEAPNGPTSRGVCKYCGEVRSSINSMPPPKFVMNLTDKEFDRIRETLKRRKLWGYNWSH